MSISSILVGVDHSDRSDKALKRANTLALLHDARLVIEYALDIDPASRLKGLLEQVAVEETQRRAAGVFGKDAGTLEIRADPGRPFEVMRDVAQDMDADLVVLGAHRAGPEPMFSGATARRLINVAPAPVLVVKDEPRAGYANVMVGYDDSNAARAALRFAHDLAPNAHFTIVTACMIPFSARRQEAEMTAMFEADMRRMVEEALKQRSSDKAPSDVIVRAGEAFATIMDAVRDRKPDLLVLGTSMPALYRQVFGGGIVDLIAADPPCDLLVVKT